MEAWVWMRTLLELSLIIVGTPGNILIIAVFALKRDKISAHIFILGLAIVDLTQCLTRPFTLFLFLPENANLKHNNLTICKLEYFLPFLSIFVSVLLTIAIAFDRYFAICKPHAHIMTIRRAKMTVLICFALSVILALPAPIAFGLREYPVVGSRCVVTAPEWTLTLLFCCFYLVGIVGVLVIILLYARIHWVLRKRKRVGISPALPDEASTQNTTCDSTVKQGESLSVMESNASNPSNATVSSSVANGGNRNPRRPIPSPKVKSKTTMMLVVTTIVFILTWIPVISTFNLRPAALLLLKNTNIVAYTLVRFSKVLMLVNHMVNPFIYGLVSKRFREDAIKVMHKIRRKLFANCY